MPTDGTKLTNLLCQPTDETIPTRKLKDSTSIIEELEVIKNGLALIYKSQKVILQNQ